MDDVIKPGLRDELITRELAERLSSLASKDVRDENLSTAEGLERLGRHLLRVARRMKTPNTSDELRHSVGVANAAVASLGAEFEGDQVALPPRVLKAIASPASLSTVPQHPRIPLAASELLVNGAGEPSMGSALLEELRCAQDVDLICAFVGFTGFNALREELRRLVDRGGRLRIITSTYLGATSPKALDEFVRLGGEVKVNYQGHATKLHAKAWLFHRPGELDTAFVGSSNLSDAALFSGLEWNVRLAHADAPGVFTRIRSTFDTYWASGAYETYTLADRERLDTAISQARGVAADGFSKKAKQAISSLELELAEAYANTHLHAKPHQQGVLDTLHLRRTSFDEHRHLVVAATGTGKTVMAALDYARLCKPGEPRPRLLFVAHREQILEQARRTFRRALEDHSFGDVLTGASTNLDQDQHVFAMVQTLANRLHLVSSDAFDVIYVDEAHHGSAESWRRVISHFNPREIVGLTATPERTDGTDISALFGGQYTTELRLWEAVDDQLLAPFDYVGVDDGTDLRQLAWHSGDYATSDLSSLYTGDHERVKSVVRAIHQWVDEPGQMKALGFCVTKEHARFMAEQFAEHGLKSAYLTGDDEQADRDSVLAALGNGALQAVFSVDVLGEGVDVPDVDTLLLLRPTQSSVLFTQQLGRGLRTSPGKTRCLVMDFIGQHRAEYRFEDRFKPLVNAGNGTLREQAEAGFPFLPAACSITLERVVRDRVLASLRASTAKPGLVAMRKELRSTGASSLAQFLVDTGRSRMSFYATDNRRMSWTRLQRAAGVDAVTHQPSDPDMQLEEADLLRRIGYLQHVTDPDRIDTWLGWIAESKAPEAGVMSVMEQRLAMQLMHQLLMTPKALQLGFDMFWRHPAVRAELTEFLTMSRSELDTVPLPLRGLEAVPLRAHARYTRAEVFAAIGTSTLARPKEHREGVYFDEESSTQLMFVTLHKDQKRFSSSVQYKDHALSPDLFHWESPNSWRQGSPAMQRCIGAGPSPSQHRVLFVRERGSGAIEGTFRCLGKVDLAGDLMGDRPVSLTWRLQTPMPEVVFESAALLSPG